jgi:hypothetical protein
MSRGRPSRYEYELERFIAACEPADLDEVQRLKKVFGRVSIWIIFRLAAILNRTGKDR